MELLDKFSYYVYIVTDRDKTLLETGVTGDLSIRLQTLEKGYQDNINNEDNTHACIYMVYSESYVDATKALLREKEIKNFSRKKKEELINACNPEWRFENDEIRKVNRSLLL